MLVLLRGRLREMNSGLKSKTVLVTGGAGGIGSEICKSFNQEGVNLVIHCNSAAAKAEALKAELKNEKILVVQADLTNENQVEKMFEAIDKKFGALHVLVANAGIWPPQDIPTHEMSLEHFKKTIDVNLTSVFLCMRGFFKQIIRHQIKDPSAVLVGSTAGAFGEAMHADYAAAKSALMYGYVKSLKNEIVKIAPLGRVNVVAPGWTVGEMAADFSSNQDAVKRTLQTVALRKIARAKDVANTVLFLSSNLASHSSGQVVMVDGGMDGRVLHSPNEIDVTKA